MARSIVRPSLVTAAAAEPVTLAELKSHLRISHAEQDTYLTHLLTSARAAVEGFTHRQMVNATFDGWIDDTPDDGDIYLFPAVASSITSIKSYTTAGVESTFSSSAYELDVTVEPSRVRLKHGYAWPAALREYKGLVVRFVAGYGASASDVPEGVKLAVQMLSAQWYAYPVPSITGTIYAEIPNMLKQLLAPFKVPMLS